MNGQRVRAPANAVFFFFPACTGLAIEDVAGVLDIFFELLGGVPLCVLVHGWRSGNVSAWEDLLGVSEDLLTPPLELVVRGWRKGANERTCEMLVWTLVC